MPQKAPVHCEKGLSWESVAGSCRLPNPQLYPCAFLCALRALDLDTILILSLVEQRGSAPPK